MPEQIVLESPEELIEAALSMLSGKISPEDVSLSPAFSIRIKIADPAWSYKNKIDYRIASLVLDIQKDILGMYSSISGEKVDLRNLHKFDKNFVVKVEVQDGCVEAIVKLSNFFKTALSNMTGNQKLAALAIVCALLAYGGKEWLNFSHLESIEKTRVKELDEETKKVAINALKEANIAMANNQATPTHLASRISSESTVEFGGKEKLTKEQIKKIIKDQVKDADLREQNFTIDAKYDMPSYNYEEQTARLRIGGFEFDASTKSLPEDVKRYLQHDANEADLKGTFARVNLQVVANIRGDKLLESFITGVGEPRQGSQDILDILSKKKNKDMSLSQGTLLEYTHK